MKAVAVHPGQPNSMHLAEVDEPRLNDIPDGRGVLVTGGEREVEIPSDAINQGFVLGNKVMVGSVNASPDDFARGRDDLVKAYAFYPGWLEKLLTTPVPGLESYEQMLRELTENKDAIKVFVEVAREGAAVNGAGATAAAVGA